MTLDEGLAKVGPNLQLSEFFLSPEALPLTAQNGPVGQRDQ